MKGCCGEQQWRLKIQQKCIKHNNSYYQFFCTDTHCEEILCSECIKAHEEAHIKANKGLPQIRLLAEVQNYYTTKTAREIQYQNKKANPKIIKNVDPSQTILELIDDYFYGSAENKKVNLRIQSEGMRMPTAKKLIQLIQKSSEYQVNAKFKQKYFQFLDSLFGNDEI